MAGVSSVALLRDVQTLFDTGTASGLTDRQLLDQFTARRDAAAEAAFELLVRRHGPMVLRVCHNLLRDSNDAHDAFQATFLVLVRRSRSIRKLDSVGGWLYGVACRVAARARVDRARRRSAEGRAALRVVEAIDAPDVDETTGIGFGPIVQEEVRGLPEKYRAVVVLCYWQGMTHEQAAAQLGCPLGTVRSRLARARNLLRRRLIRRGLAPLAAVVVAGLDPAPATASVAAFRLATVPPELVHTTIQAALRFSAGHVQAQIVSGFAASLVRSVLWSMTMIKIKVVVVGLVLVGLVGTSGWFAAINGPFAQAQAKVGQKAAPSDEKAKSASSQKLYSLVKGQATVRRLVPDRSRVKKGDIVCELDSAPLADQLLNHQITFLTAKANHENSKLERETAEISVVEYEEGIFRSEDAETSGDVNIAEAELALAEAERDVAVRAAKTHGSDLPVKRAELAVLRARFALEKAQSRRKTLLDFTKGKTLKALKSSVGKARSRELAQQSIEELQTAKLKGLQRQIASCKIAAPMDGTIVYAGRVEEGAAVHEGQVLFEIVPSPETKAEIR